MLFDNVRNLINRPQDRKPRQAIADFFHIVIRKAYNTNSRGIVLLDFADKHRTGISSTNNQNGMLLRPVIRKNIQIDLKCQTA